MKTPSYKTLKQRCDKQTAYFHKLHTMYANDRAELDQRYSWGFWRRLLFAVRGK